MKIFELQTKGTRYTYPLIKIIVSLLIIFFGIFRNRIFTISIVWLNILVTLIFLVAGVAAVLCIYISVGELFYVRKNRKEIKK